MTDLKKAAQQALEALWFANSLHWVGNKTIEKAIDSLQAALEQPEQGGKTGWPPGLLQDDCRGLSKWLASQPDARRRVREAVAALEPVANNPDPYHLSRILHELAGSASMCWEHVDRAGVFQSTQAADVVAAAIAEIRQRMKDAPPRREWRGLTEEEIEAIPWHGSPLQFARAIEAALRSKNHG
jgi:hypothetical protein